MSGARPSLFLIGAPKCGTTSMNAYVQRHPQIYMALKEGHHFASDLLDAGSFYLPNENYQSLFDGHKDELVCGDCSVFYLYSSIAAQSIHAYDPDTKIVVMLRNPVEVLPSLHSEYLFRNVEDIEDFRDALKAEPERREYFSAHPEKKNNRILLYRDVVNFVDQLERYYALFNRDQIHVIVYDDFKQDMLGVYKALPKFIGVDSNFSPSFNVLNANKVARSRALGKFARTPPRPLYWFARNALPRSWQVKISRTL